MTYAAVLCKLSLFTARLPSPAGNGLRNPHISFNCAYLNTDTRDWHGGSIMKRHALAFATLALSVGLAFPTIGMSTPRQEGTPPVADAGPGGWDAPPREFREIQRQGFHDGIDGARKDFDHHRAPNVEGRSEYRRPHVPPSARDDYRDGFRRGYEAAMNHLNNH
jgi:hypothetical protein